MLKRIASAARRVDWPFIAILTALLVVAFLAGFRMAHDLCGANLDRCGTAETREMVR